MQTVPFHNEAFSVADRTAVSEIMTRGVFCVTDNLGLDELEQLFLERGIGGAPVINDEGHVVGVVSKTDLLRQHHEDADSGEIDLSELEREIETPDVWCMEEQGFHGIQPKRGRIRDIMTPIAYTIRESTSVAQAAALMAFEEIHRLPIVSDQDERLVGVLSALDILRWIGEREGYLAQRKQPDDAPTIS